MMTLVGGGIVMDFKNGTVLQSGKYLIQQVLGQSPLSLTLQASTTPSRVVILKTLNPKLLSHRQYSSAKQQFTESVNRLAQCQHPALVQFIELFEEQGLPFAVMDSMAGKSLADIVNAQGVLPIELAIRYVQQVGAALEALHRQGLIHQNVSPRNILQPAGANIVVLVNVTFVSAGTLAEPARSHLPSAGTYAAIEQYQSAVTATPASDVYGLAGTLYFLLTQNPPIVAPLRHQTALMAPRQFNSRISAALETAILQGLEMNPKARPALSEWLASLTAASAVPVSLVHPLVPPPHPTSLPEPSPNLGSGSPVKPVQASSVSRPSSSSQPSMLSVPSKRFSGAIFTTVAIAAAIGIGTGLALRLAATTTGSGTSFFNSRQSFPTLDNWPGESLPIQPPEILPPAPASVQTPRVERAIAPPAVPPAVPPAAPEVIPTLPEAAPVVPAPDPPAAVMEPVAPPPAAPAPVAPPESSAPPAPSAPVPEPAPPPPVNQSVSPAGSSN
jgi:serine/threonine-protein kinase